MAAMVSCEVEPMLTPHADRRSFPPRAASPPCLEAQQGLGARAGKPVLIDFGASRRGNLRNDWRKKFHLWIATSGYISPAQLVGSRNDPRSE
jgi:hypothetical protein